jgi:tetratricopeptide (TPR) repeat protein
MGILKTAAGDYEGAIRSYNQVIERTSGVDSLSHLGTAWNNLGYLYKLQEEYRTALNFLYKALDFEIAQENAWDAIYPLYNIGSSYERLNMLDSARFYLDSALRGSRVHDDPYIESLALHDLGWVYNKTGYQNKGTQFLERSYQIASKALLTPEAEKSARTLSTFYVQMGNTSKAYQYLSIAEQLSDSLNQDEATRKIAQLESEFVLEQKLKEERMKNEIELMRHRMETAESKTIMTGFGFAMVLLAVVTILIYQGSEKRKKANTELRELNAQISEQKEELLQQSEELNTLNESLNDLNNTLEDKVRERTAALEEKNATLAEYAFFNAHKLRAPVATILGLIELYNNEQLSVIDRREIIERLKRSTQELDHITRQIQRILEENDLVSR